jgi:dTMP kinase
VTLEGIDRSGKTTQVARLCAALAARGLPVGVVGVPGGSLREPGGTPAGEAIRDVLLHRAHDVGPWTEALLYAAARAQLVADVVRPSLDAGLIVVLDRYVDSSLAYQGWARGLGIDVVAQVNERATGGLWPDLTLLLRVRPGRAAGRAGGPPDRLESEGAALQARVAAGYDELARRHPGRIVALDGERPVDEVALAVEQATLAPLEAAGFAVGDVCVG